MKTQTIDLYEYFKLDKPQGAKALLTTLLIDDYDFCKGRIRPAMLVLGGGGYQYVSDREKEPIAIYYLSLGYNVFVLDYSIAPLGFPNQLIEACMATAYIRENANELLVDENHVAAVGFSAGGHLLGLLATMYACEEVKAALGEKYKLCRIDAAVFSYPVISSTVKAHQGSILVQCAGDESIRDRISIDKNVTEDTPPAFIWATSDDACVPVENSLYLAAAYKQCGVPFELHIFESGVHGLSLATKEVNTENKCAHAWLELSRKWLKNRGFKID